jgi:hypothetical protein
MTYHKGKRKCLTDWLNCLIISEVCRFPGPKWLTNRIVLMTNRAFFSFLMEFQKQLILNFIFSTYQIAGYGK